MALTGHLEAGPSNSLVVTRVIIKYQGPAVRLYVCWGLKKRDEGFIPTGVDFNNGDGLAGGSGNFGYGIIDVERSANGYESRDRPVTIMRPLSLSGIPLAQYHTFIWVGRSPTAQESELLGVDVDADTITVSSGQYLPTYPEPYAPEKPVGFILYLSEMLPNETSYLAVWVASGKSYQAMGVNGSPGPWLGLAYIYPEGFEQSYEPARFTGVPLSGWLSVSVIGEGGTGRTVRGDPVQVTDGMRVQFALGSRTYAEIQ